MSFPVYLQLGPLLLHPHWVFEGLAYFVGVGSVGLGRRRSGDVLDTRTRWVLVATGLVGGLVGSRLLSLVENPFLLNASWNPALAPGKTIVGGLVGGLLAVEWTKRLLKIRVPTGDLLTLPIIIGIAIGRIGCFLSGLEDQSYGVATAMAWGIDFGDGVARHPTQLYEIAFLVGLGTLLLMRADRLSITGDRFKVFLLGYASFRVLVDFIKPGVRVGGLSTIQWVCLAVMAFYTPHAARLVTTLLRRPVQAPEGEPT
jgi:prolipoprotein diacylglyceryltransferase